MNRRFLPIRSLRNWLSSLPISLRAKLILGTLLIVFFALAGMGYYIYYRTQTTNTYLTTELEQSVRLKAEAQLVALSNEHAAVLNTFFSSISEDVGKFGNTVENLLSQENILKTGNYWDASTSLFRTTTDSWDNQNSDDSSVFIPAGSELSEALISEINTIKYTEFTVPAILEAKSDIIAIYYGGVQKETIYYPNIDLAGLVPPDFDVTQRPWFLAASPQRNPMSRIVWSVPYQDAALHGLVVTSSMPVYDSVGSFRGVAAMDIQLNRISDLLSKIRIGGTGYAFIADKENRLIAMPQAAYNHFGLNPDILPLGEIVDRSKLTGVPPEFFEILTRISSGQNGLTTMGIDGVEHFVVYQPIQEVGYGLAIVVPTEELLSEAIIVKDQVSQVTRSTLLVSFILIAAVLLTASFAALAMANALTSPLRILTRTAEKITGGDLDAKADVKSHDEIGTLARILNTMAASLKDLIQSLELRVAERTASLELAREQSEKRARDLQIVGEISSVITSEQKIEVLLPLITRLVSDRFSFYHVGIFLIDETGRFAVLQAANSEGGQIMLARGHKLEVGVTGLVGYVANSGTPRIALDVGDDAVFFNNPDLPETRSEISLPLISRGRTIGVLDVQSDQPGAFSGEDINNLGILADQIGSVIENATLFGQSQQAIAEMQVLYRQYIRQEWDAFLVGDTPIGYHQGLTGGKKLELPPSSGDLHQIGDHSLKMPITPNIDIEQPSFVVPIKLRGQSIGSIQVKAPTKGRDWSKEEINLIEAVSERLALALENARLVQDSQRRAAREQVIGEITGKIGASINMKNVLQTAVEELGQVLAGSEVVIELQPEVGITNEQ